MSNSFYEPIVHTTCTDLLIAAVSANRRSYKKKEALGIAEVRETGSLKLAYNKNSDTNILSTTLK